MYMCVCIYICIYMYVYTLSGWFVEVKKRLILKYRQCFPPQCPLFDENSW